MSRRYTAIIRIKTDIDQAIAETLAQLGEGANPEYQQIETVFSLNNTPIVNGYVRVVVAERIAQALQQMLDAGVISEHIEVVRIEWHGQDMVDAGTDEDGQPVYGRVPFQADVENVLDEDGLPTGEMRPVYLGRIMGY
jgi:hypothetical protein